MVSLKKILTKILQQLVVTEADGTIASNISADKSTCHLVKQGERVRCYFVIGNTNGTTTIPNNTTLFTIPSDYRPKTTIVQHGLAYRATGIVIPVNIQVSTGGAISQITTSNATTLMATMEWVTN